MSNTLPDAIMCHRPARRPINTLVFRVLLDHADSGAIPRFCSHTSKETVKTSTDMKKLSQVLKAKWREWPNSKLRETGAIFGWFLSHLAELGKAEQCLMLCYVLDLFYPLTTHKHYLKCPILRIQPLTRVEQGRTRG